MSSVVAEFVGVVKDYPAGFLRRRPLRAVAGVSLAVRAGEVFGLIGPNRAGKTTLVKLLLCLSRPTAGEVRRLGRAADDRSTLARVGYVHENHAFPRYLSATSLLEYYGALSLLPFEEVKRRVPPLLEQVGLADRAREPIAHFSKGMLQRLGIAQALLNDPDLLVLDEPGEGLDLSGRRLIFDVAAQMRERGKSVLLISHQLADVEKICDRVAVLVKGRVALAAPVAELTRGADGNYLPLEKAVKRYYE